MGFALRCLFFLVALGGLAVFLYLHRRRTNQLLLVLLIVYAVSAGSRLLSAETDDEMLWSSAVALAGLLVLWGGVWLGARWLERKGTSEPD